MVGVLVAEHFSDKLFGLVKVISVKVKAHGPVGVKVVHRQVSEVVLGDGHAVVAAGRDVVVNGDLKSLSGGIKGHGVVGVVFHLVYSVDGGQLLAADNQTVITDTTVVNIF